MSGPACIRCGQRLRAEGAFCHRCGLRAGGAFDAGAGAPRLEPRKGVMGTTPRRKRRTAPVVALLVIFTIFLLCGLLTSVRSVRTEPATATVTGTIPQAIQRDIQRSVEGMARSAAVREQQAEFRRQTELVQRQLAEQQRAARQQLEESLERARTQASEVTRRMQQERIVRVPPPAPGWAPSPTDRVEGRPGPVVAVESERAWKMISDALLRGELMNEEQVRRLLGAPQKVTRTPEALGRTVWTYERPTAGSVVFWPDGRVAQVHLGRNP